MVLPIFTANGGHLGFWYLDGSDFDRFFWSFTISSRIETVERHFALIFWGQVVYRPVYYVIVVVMSPFSEHGMRAVLFNHASVWNVHVFWGCTILMCEEFIHVTVSVLTGDKKQILQLQFSFWLTLESKTKSRLSKKNKKYYYCVILLSVCQCSLQNGYIMGVGVDLSQYTLTLI